MSRELLMMTAPLPTPTPGARRRIGRRALGAAVCLSAPALLLVSLYVGIRSGSRSPFAGIWWLIPAALIVCLNLYTSILRPLLHHLRGRGFEDYRHISGVPNFGSIFILASAIFGMGATATAAIGLGLFLIDTGSPLAFLIATWRDESLWDGILPPDQSASQASGANGGPQCS